MAGDGGLNALSLLPENELPQWQQNIALRAENPSGRAVRDNQVLFADRMDFLRSNFLQVLDLLIFRQRQPGHWAEVVCHFFLLVSMFTYGQV